METWCRASGMDYGRISIFFTAIPRCSIGSKARMRTTLCKAIPTSRRGVRPSSIIAHPRKICTNPTTAGGRTRSPSCTRSPSWQRSNTRNYYMNIGNTFSDPVARLLYAEIASVEEQDITRYESVIDPEATWLLHEANEVYNYCGCATQDTNPRIKAISEGILDYELGHLHGARQTFRRLENRDPFEILPRASAYRKRAAASTLRFCLHRRALGAQARQNERRDDRDHGQYGEGDTDRAAHEDQRIAA